MDKPRPLKSNEREVLQGQHLHHCPQHPTVSTLLPGFGAAKGTEECSSREKMAQRPGKPQVQALPAESPWQHRRNHTQVPTDTASAKVKQPEHTKVAPYPAPD